MTAEKQAGWGVAVGSEIAYLSVDANGSASVEWHAGRFTIRTTRGDLEDLHDAIDVALRNPAKRSAPVESNSDEAPVEPDQLTFALAAHFFRDHPLGTDENVERLARAIQLTVQETIVAIEQEDDK